MSGFMIDLDFLKKVSFFSDFTEETLSYLRNCLRPITISPQENVLTQDEENDTLFILMDGMAEVLVDEKNVTLLHKRGDLIGEMSLILKTKCSATVKAVTPVELMSLRMEFLDVLPAQQKAQVEAMIYRKFSLLLGDKLEKTNHKAKLFEETNQELQKTQDDLKKHNESLEEKIKERTKSLEEKSLELEKQYVALQAGQMQLKESSQTKEMALQKIHELARTELPEFRLKVSFAANQPPEEQANLLKEIENRISSIEDFLTPFIALYESEKKIKSKKVLLAESVVKQHVISKMALGGTGILLDIVKKKEDLLQKLDEEQYDLIFFSTDFMEEVPIIHDKNPLAILVLLCSDQISSYIDILPKYPYLKHIISKDITDRALTIKSIATTVTKIFTTDFFGPEKLLNWGTEIFAEKVNNSTKREEHISNMNAYLKNMGVRSSFLTNINIVAEEMLMNAIYDAPTDGSGKPLFNHLARTEVIKLEEAQQGTFRYGCDGVNVAISMTDPFGRLTKSTILKYVSSLYQDSSQNLNDNQDKGGAGKGMYLIMRLADLVIFNVLPTTRTEVLAIFNLEKNKDQDLNLPAFHFFEI